VNRQLILGVMVLVCLAVAGPAMASVGYVEQFSSNNAGWYYGYGTNFVSPQNDATWVSPGGNPGGYISGTSSNLYAIWTYATAPYDDMTGLTMTIDTKVTDGETGNAQFYVGRGGTYFIGSEWSITGEESWTTHVAPLNTTTFTSWTGVNDYVFTLAQVLQAPTDIGIFFGGGVACGEGDVFVDNFGTIDGSVKLTADAAPEPATLIIWSLLGGLGLVIGWRRKRAA
jgi:hypothetical protein